MCASDEQSQMEDAPAVGDAAVAVYSAASGVLGFYSSEGLRWGELDKESSTSTRLVYKNTLTLLNGALEFLKGEDVLRAPTDDDVAFISALGALEVVEKMRRDVLDSRKAISVECFRALTWLGPQSVLPVAPGSLAALIAAARAHNRARAAAPDHREALP